VFLLGGRLNTVSAVRSLGARQVKVTVLDDHGEGRLAARSRHCHRYLDTPSGTSTSQWWLKVLCEQGDGAVVFPCSDVGLEFLARNRPELVGAGCMPIEADDEGLLAALDKEVTYQRAREAGISAPNTTRIRTSDDLAAAISNLAFPFAVKPTSAHRFWDALRPNAALFDAWLVHPKGSVVDNKDQFLALVEPLVELGIEVLATEVVVGPDNGYCSYYTYIDADGQPLFHFTKRKPRQFPIHFGGGTFHVTEWLPDVADLGLRVCEQLGLRGICNVEFKRDSRSGALRLIECNARLTATDALERKAGLDLPWIAYARAIGESVSVPSQFPDGICQWLPLNDLKAWASYRRAGELTTRAWVVSLARRQTFTVFDLDDLGPSYWSAISRLKSVHPLLTRTLGQRNRTPR
jgi:D-aspartate ligase